MKKIVQLDAPSIQGGFHSEAEILPRLDVSRRTLKTWRDKGLIPFIRLPGSRLVKYHWASVEAALLSRQTGAITKEL
jgi:predicted site-specific integrase-resolvase